jgi:hypothetical protein
MKMEQTECSETSAYKIQAPGNYPEKWIPQQFSNLVIIHLLPYEDGTDSVFRNVDI